MIQILLSVKTIPSKKFRLGYRLNYQGIGQEVNIWDFVKEGDNLLLNLPCVTEKQLSEGISLEIINAFGKFESLPILGEKNGKTKSIVIRRS